MQTRQGNMLQSLQTVQTFLEEHADKLGSVVNSGAKKKLAEAIADLAAHAVEQSGSNFASQGATKKQLVLRHALLHDHMEPISRIARVDLPLTPEIEPLRMPKGKPSAQRLAAAARGMARTAEVHAGVFVAAGLPQDFIARLKAATDALLVSLDERLQSRGKRSGATQGLTARLTAGRKIVHVLDSFVTTALRDDPALLANWKVVKRVRRATSRSVLTPSPALSLTPVPGPTPSAS